MLDRQTQQVIDKLVSEVGRQRRQIEQRPIYSLGGAGGGQFLTLQIIGGNTLTTGQAGIKYESGGVATVPSAYDPDVTSSFIDGIGRAWLYINGVVQANRVLVVNAGGLGSAITYALLGTTDFPFTRGSVSIPLDGDPTTTVTAYIPDWL